MNSFSGSNFGMLTHGNGNWRDWSRLPSFVVFGIVNRFTSIDDCNQFGRVCVSWWIVVQKIFANHIFMLINHPSKENQMALYDLSNRVIYDFKLKSLHSKSYLGSSFGWMVTSKTFNYNEIQLQNPFCSCIIDLPLLDTSELHGIRKAVLSSDPQWSDNYVVMAITGCSYGAAFCKKGDDTWTSIRENLKIFEYPEDSVSQDTSRYRMCKDVIFFSRTNQFYVLLSSGKVVAIDFTGDGETKLRVTEVAPSIFTKTYNQFAKMYLVEDFSSGDLLQIYHCWNGFGIFKLDHINGWMKLGSIGDNILFLSDYISKLRPASDCPGYPLNCICYPTFTTAQISWNLRGRLSTVYNLENGTRQPHHIVNSQNFELSTIWLTPFSA